MVNLPLTQSCGNRCVSLKNIAFLFCDATMHLGSREKKRARHPGVRYGDYAPSIWKMAESAICLALYIIKLYATPLHSSPFSRSSRKRSFLLRSPRARASLRQA